MFANKADDIIVNNTFNAVTIYWEDVCHEATDRREWKEWTADVFQAQEGLRSKV